MWLTPVYVSKSDELLHAVDGEDDALLGLCQSGCAHCLAYDRREAHDVFRHHVARDNDDDDDEDDYSVLSARW